MLKYLLVVSLFLLSGNSTALATEPYAINEKAIVKVACREGIGTAFKITQDKYVTAKHVAEMTECTVGGQPLKNLDTTSTKDIAIFTGPHSPSWAKVSCKGFEENKTYLAVGYGLGFAVTMNNPWISTDLVLDQYNTFVGDGLPGMSGGPIVNRKGEVTGVITMRWPTRGYALKFSKICE